jgi:RNA polymerase sigma-54 factor
MEISNKLNLNQRLETSIRLTPEMRLKLNILHANHLELKDILKEEEEINEAIDHIEDNNEDAGIKDEKDESKETTFEDEEDDINDTQKDVKTSDSTQSQAAGEDIDNNEDETADSTREIVIDDKVGHFDESPDMPDQSDDDYGYDKRESEYDPSVGKLENFKQSNIPFVEKNDLQSELLKQLNQLDIQDDMYLDLHTLITSLDEKGFLSKNRDEIAAESAIPAERLNAALDMLHFFDPVGTGAADMKECLLIQLKHNRMEDTLAYKMVAQQFELMKKQNYSRLAAIFKVKESDIKKAEKVIGALKPYPGFGFSEDANEYVEPDIIVEEDENGKYKAVVPWDFPVIRMSKQYKQYKNSPVKELREWAEKYENRIKAIASAMAERKNTIEKVVQQIIEIQDDYLRNESAALKPLVYREIAQKTGYSESTVSRIVSNKYIQLPYGVYHLKTFFTAKVGEVSANELMMNVKTLIESEDPKNPFTDSEIEQKLAEMGKPVARRTITKYRKNLSIPSVNKRKK